MLFNSFIFLFKFLPLVWVGFFLIGYKYRAGAAAFLALASLGFYSYWYLGNLPILAISIAANYWLGKQLIPSPGVSDRKRRHLLILAITLNLVALAYFKYINFFIDNIDVLLSAVGLQPWRALQIILPLGISFYTFTQIAFLVDSYQGKVRERNFVHYVLFVTFFPHLIAGPIIHHAQIMPQFDKPVTYRIQWQKVALGIAIFTIGLSKKLLLADPMSVYVDALYATPEAQLSPDMATAWFGTVAFAFQVYFDFSGYSDMAVGLGLLFGIILPMNFNSPYKATSIISFWQRWHMTLTNYVWEYIYTPITLKLVRRSVRKPKAVRTVYELVIPTLITFVIIGFWHGANWTFIFFGLFHALLLIINHLWRRYRRKAPEAGFALRAFYWGLTFGSLLLSLVLFRADSMHHAMSIYTSMFDMQQAVPALQSIWDMAFYALLAICLFICLALPSTYQMVPSPQKPDIAPAIDITRRAWMAFALGIMFVVSVLHISNKSPFLYFQF